MLTTTTHSDWAIVLQIFRHRATMREDRTQLRVLRRSRFGLHLNQICPHGLKSPRRQSMQRYDPLKAPVPEEWLTLDEQERIDFVQDYHSRMRTRLQNAKVHAMAHVIVENQIALGDETPVQRTAQRLMDEGLDRHEAVHAIGMVLFEFMHDLMKAPVSGSDPNARYFAALKRLTAEDWRRSG